jgi:hypothetical protein
MLQAVEDAPYAKVVRTPGPLPTWQAVEEFIFAGKATFTLVSVRTGVRFTYKVTKRKLNPADDTVYFLNLLRGPDNEADYAYMGVLRKDPARFFWTAASGKAGRLAAAYKALVWFVDAMKCGRAVLGDTLEVWHDGKCACCGRKLTVPESIASGFGPSCASRRAV